MTFQPIQNALHRKADEYHGFIEENAFLHNAYQQTRQSQAEEQLKLLAKRDEVDTKLEAVTKDVFFKPSPETLADPKRLFLFAENIKKDAPEQAQEFLVLAANKGHLEAMYSLGWFDRAAALGHTKSMLKLFESGNDQSYLWILKAAKLGDREAIAKLVLIPANDLYMAGCRFCSSGKLDDGVQLLTEAARKGKPEAREKLAKMHQNFLEDAAIKGDTDAMLELAPLCNDIRRYTLIFKAVKMGSESALQRWDSISGEELFWAACNYVPPFNVATAQHYHIAYALLDEAIAKGYEWKAKGVQLNLLIRIGHYEKKTNTTINIKSFPWQFL